MQVYLPIGEISVNIFVLLGIGGGIGFLSGLFGVGGGFLLTPLLIFIGIPPAVAVGTGANQIVASSISGVLAHFKRGTVDVKMGVMLLIGGILGSGVGVWLFTLLRAQGQVDLVIKLTYVFFLGAIGLLMFIESVGALVRTKRRATPKRRTHNALTGLPFKMRFRRSLLYISALLPLGVGFVVGILTAIMGVGGGFIMVPAMIYLLGMPTAVVVGTSLFQIIFVTTNVTVLQAINNFAVDIPLALLLLVGGVIGAQFGSRASTKMNGEQLRVLLALMVLGVCFKIALELTLPPADIYVLGTMK
ncbi:sulfite exporter TauE/SafE family protein [Magnetovibrio sp.]|uniref:sulfite exporter TauE/SafE family protein n=1 Tax=Magnetovibrio sp. TaxID=2024836 RepID=UPI002F938BB0